MTEAESAAPKEPPATLEFREASFQRSGQALTEALGLCSRGHSIGLVGQWQPLFQALTGEAQVRSGSARIFGCEVALALARGVVGVAPCDPPVSAFFSVREYLEQAARLSHGSRARATADARRALDAYGLAALGPQKLGQLAPYQRRALGIVAAALTAPPVICLEAPLRGLDAAPADYVATLCVHAAKGSLLVVSADPHGAPSAERSLLEQCDELFVLQRGALVAHGAPKSVFAPATRYLLTLASADDAALRSALDAAGCRLTAKPSPATFSARLSPSRRVTRYLIELPEAASSDLLLDAALDTGVTVLELEPLLMG